MSSPELLFTGINGTTGGYLSGPLTPEEVYAAVVPPALVATTSEHYDELRTKNEKYGEDHYELAFAIDPNSLAQTGWGVIFPRDAPAPLIDALQPLLAHRRAAAGQHYYQFSGSRGVWPDEQKAAFLARHGVGSGQPVTPTSGVPFYLLLVGGPADLSWRFQYELDVDYAVGRVFFETPDGQPDYAAYRRYAVSVVLAETTAPPLPTSAGVFAPRHDPATNYSADSLAKPLLDEWPTWEETAGWRLTEARGAKATKARLGGLVGGADTPALLFTASHGIGFEATDPLNRQRPHQGAVVCQDWKDLPDKVGAGSRGGYFSADDVPDDARVHGLVSFHFACFGAGTPAVDDFPDLKDKVFKNEKIAPAAFAARLPMRLLGHPNGGALAFVGHVDRAWSCSFLLPQTGVPQVGQFTQFMRVMAAGYRIGYALDAVNRRYASLASQLTNYLNQLRANYQPDEAFKGDVTKLWLEHTDARNYVLFGDPAAQLRTAADGRRTDLAEQLAKAAITSPAAPLTPTPTPAPPSTSPMPGDPAQMAAAQARYDSAEGSPTSFSADSGTLLRSNDSSRLTARLRRKRAKAPPPPSVADDGMVDFAPIPDVVPEDTLGLERLFSTDGLLPVRYLDRGRLAARAVGRVVVGNPPRTFGTGFLVSPRLVLTNNHVLPSADLPAGTGIEFEYFERADGAVVAPARVGFAPATFFATDPRLDYTLIALADPQPSRGHLPMAGGPDAYVIGERVSIIQHPGGRPMQVALRNNEVVREFHHPTDPTRTEFVQYRTDTEPGSSGAPVFNDEFELVALHHSGVPRTNADGQPLLKGGGVWTPGVPTELVDWVANEGVLIPAILTDLQARPLDPGGRGLLDELLRAANAPPPGRADVLAADRAAVQPPPLPPPTTGTTVVELTVPLRVRVTVEVLGPSPDADPTRGTV